MPKTPVQWPLPLSLGFAFCDCLPLRPGVLVRLVRIAVPPMQVSSTLKILLCMPG